MRTLLMYVGIAMWLTGCMPPGSSEGRSTSVGSKVCEVQLAKVFEQTFYAVVKDSCTNCHRTGGPGNGAFADPDVSIAFDNFMIKGAAKIEAMATSSHYFSQSLVPTHQSRIAAFKGQWTAGVDDYNACLSGDEVEDGPGEAQFLSVALAAPSGFAPTLRPEGVITFTSLSWDLETRLESPTGAKVPVTVAVDVRPYYGAANQLLGYEFFDPTLKLKTGITKSHSFRGLRIELLSAAGSSVLEGYAELSGTVAMGGETVLRNGYVISLPAAMAGPDVRFRVSFSELSEM